MVLVLGIDREDVLVLGRDRPDSVSARDRLLCRERDKAG